MGGKFSLAGLGYLLGALVYGFVAFVVIFTVPYPLTVLCLLLICLLFVIIFLGGKFFSDC